MTGRPLTSEGPAVGLNLWLPTGGRRPQRAERPGDVSHADASPRNVSVSILNSPHRRSWAPRIDTDRSRELSVQARLRWRGSSAMT